MPSAFHGASFKYRPGARGKIVSMKSTQDAITMKKSNRHQLSMKYECSFRHSPRPHILRSISKVYNGVNIRIDLQ